MFLIVLFAFAIVSLLARDRDLFLDLCQFSMP